MPVVVFPWANSAVNVAMGAQLEHDGRGVCHAGTVRGLQSVMTYFITRVFEKRCATGQLPEAL